MAAISKIKILSGTTYDLKDSGAVRYDAAQSLTGTVSVDSSGNVTITGQKGQALANLGLGSMAVLDYKEIV